MDINNTSDESLLVIDEQEKQLNTFKSFFNLINAKSDSILKTFEDNVIIEIDDIKSINELILRKIRNHYEHDGFICNVVVNFNDRTSSEFKCWQEFASQTWNGSPSIKSIIIKWKFNIRMPQYQDRLPQEHTVVLKICSSMRPEEVLNLLFSGSIENIEEVDRLMCPVVARVDYVDALLANEILKIISDWVSRLHHPINEKNKGVRIVKSNRKFIAKCIEYGTLGLFIVALLSAFSYFLSLFNMKNVGQMTTEQLICVTNFIVGACIICFIVKKIAYITAKKVYNLLAEYGTCFTFNITSGDRQIQRDTRNKGNSSIKTIILNIVSTFLFNIICIIFSVVIKFLQ